MLKYSLDSRLRGNDIKNLIHATMLVKPRYDIEAIFRATQQH
ncbi:hypothetical protein [Rickettsia endosymbiont of Polydrusus tereticollis]